jgi:hypothetical protein
MKIGGWGSCTGLVVATQPSERLGLRPCTHDQRQSLREALARLGGVDAVGDVLVRGAPQHAGDHPPAGEGVEHGELLRHPHGVLDGDARSEQGDLRPLDSLGDGAGHHHRIGRQRPGGVVMLGDADPVEADLVGQLEEVQGAPHRGLRRLGGVVGGGDRPALVCDRSLVGDDREQGGTHRPAPTRIGARAWPRSDRSAAARHRSATVQSARAMSSARGRAPTGWRHR